MIIRLTNDLSNKNVNRLSYMYSSIERADDFYRLYLEADFDAYDYLMLLITLLKHDEESKAKYYGAFQKVQKVYLSKLPKE